MSRFTQADVTRLIKGVNAAGGKVQRVEVDASGRLTAILSEPALGTPQGETELDRIIKREKQKALERIGAGVRVAKSKAEFSL